MCIVEYWRRVMDVLVTTKLKCKRSKYRKQNGLCYYCLLPMNAPRQLQSSQIDDLDATFEHLIPKSKGGIGLRNNKVLVHRICNIIHGKITSYLINALKRNDYMDDFIRNACEILKRECVDFNDATQYVEEILLDVKTKFGNVINDDDLRRKIYMRLERVFHE